MCSIVKMMQNYFVMQGHFLSYGLKKNTTLMLQKYNKLCIVPYIIIVRKIRESIVWPLKLNIHGERWISVS